MKIIYALLFCFISLSSFAYYDQVYINQVKQNLQTELKADYLDKLIDHFGRCQGDECLTQIEDIVTFNGQDRSVCFPYTECGFYRCMEQKYRCSEVGVNYFTELAYPTCNTYLKNIKKSMFTKKGVEWIYTVMTCLQKGLVDECELRGNCSDHPDERKKVCDHITDFTLKFHPGCYINSGVGVCNLPMKDKLSIWKTVSRFLTPREREEAYKVVFHCIFKKEEEE